MSRYKASYLKCWLPIHGNTSPWRFASILTNDLATGRIVFACHFVGYDLDEFCRSRCEEYRVKHCRVETAVELCQHRCIELTKWHGRLDNTHTPFLSSSLGSAFAIGSRSEMSINAMLHVTTSKPWLYFEQTRWSAKTCYVHVNTHPSVKVNQNHKRSNNTSQLVSPQAQF